MPPADEEGPILVASADNKGIPMRRPSDQLPAGAHRKKGEKAQKKQMATVGAVYSIAPKHRTAEDVVAALFREKTAKPREKQPVPQHKHVWSSLTVERDGQVARGEEQVFDWLAEEVRGRDPKGQKEFVCLMDGQASLWEARLTYLRRDDTVEILDLLHVTPRLWEAAYLFHPEGSMEAEGFVRQRLLAILQNRTGHVVGGLRQMGTKHELRGEKKKKLNRICNYFVSNGHRMSYGAYLAAGYPIASGVIEGACRHVVKDRMERTGMRWTVDGAQAMLDLRTTYINGQWDEYQGYRIEEASHRLHPHQSALDDVEWPVAA